MTTSAVLWGDRYAPVTSAIGFLQAPLADVAECLRSWREDIHGSAQRESRGGGLEANIRLLEPLTSGVRPRELVVATRETGWTAVFDCGVTGGDPVSTVGYLARTMRVHGVKVASIPDRVESGTHVARFGARQLELYGPVPTDFLNYVRTISLVRDGARWRFDATGVIQDFEDVETYSARKVVDRFTEEMLVSYSAALGLHPFDEDFYSGPCELVTNPTKPRPGALVLTIEEARRRLGVDPA